MKRIVMTGGGTAGHVTPNIALMPALKARGFEIYYIGSFYKTETTFSSSSFSIFSYFIYTYVRCFHYNYYRNQRMIFNTYWC